LVLTVEVTKGPTMYLFSITVIHKVAEESRSGMAYAPVVPYLEPRRHWWSARPRLTQKALRPACEAEPCDRSAKVAGVAGAC
jgi:hypothetical protein